MDKMVIIEIVISMALIYFVLSAVMSGIIELLNKWFKIRGKFLQGAIYKFLNDAKNKNWGDLLYAHPLFDGMKKNYKSLPSFISSETFSTGLTDIISREGYQRTTTVLPDGKSRMEETPLHNEMYLNFREGLNAIEESDFKTTMRALSYETKDSAELKKAIAGWYDDYMDRASGWFKTKMKNITFFVAIAITLAFNIDSLKIAKSVWQNDEVRLKLVYDATVTDWENTFRSDTLLHVMSNDTTGNLPVDSVFYTSLDELKLRLDSIPKFLGHYDLPFGWQSRAEIKKEHFPDTSTEDISNFQYVTKLIGGIGFMNIWGWLITVIALSMGAPYWFNIMNKFINMRNAGNKPKTSKQ